MSVQYQMLTKKKQVRYGFRTTDISGDFIFDWNISTEVEITTNKFNEKNQIIINGETFEKYEDTAYVSLKSHWDLYQRTHKIVKILN